jgi:glycosyltransferase involved in cell wall biosynthesis
MSEPVVTVIVLMYNDLPHLHRAIQSVLSQTYRNLKIKLLDNGSTDGTWNEIQKYRSDPRVTLFRNAKNQRSEFAANEALKTDTEYLSFLFADDIYVPERIETDLKAFRADPSLDAVFSNVQAVNERDEVIQGPRRTTFEGDISLMSQLDHLMHCFFHGPSVHPCAMLIKSKTYIQLGGFKPYFHRMGDLIFFARLLSNAKVAFLKQKLQHITVWSCRRNESARNDGDPPALLFERTMLLEEYLSPHMMEKYIKIFERHDGSKIVLKNPAEHYWYIGHQALNSQAFDLRLFGFRCLYKAAEVADFEFRNNVLKMTGKTMPEYFDAISATPTAHMSPGMSAPPDIGSIFARLQALEQPSLKTMIKRFIKAIPFTVPVYRFITCKR